MSEATESRRGATGRGTKAELEEENFALRDEVERLRRNVAE
ncbi:hypothetical protein [Streptomyces sp. NRRL S-337]|nr:hypothetical protein [Streptomyces sp. NRRL S-337]